TVRSVSSACCKSFPERRRTAEGGNHAALIGAVRAFAQLRPRSIRNSRIRPSHQETAMLRTIVSARRAAPLAFVLITSVAGSAATAGSATSSQTAVAAPGILVVRPAWVVDVETGE